MSAPTRLGVGLFLKRTVRKKKESSGGGEERFVRKRPPVLFSGEEKGDKEGREESIIVYEGELCFKRTLPQRNRKEIGKERKKRSPVPEAGESLPAARSEKGMLATHQLGQRKREEEESIQGTKLLGGGSPGVEKGGW